jgi:Zn-dependent metalloprotease
MDSVKYLFARNKLDYTKFLFIGYQKDEYGSYVRCDQFVNNLIVFTSEVVFEFDKNDNYTFLSGHLAQTTNLSTRPFMNQYRVARKFVDAIEQDGVYKGNTEITGGCFDVEFGYYDLNAGTNNTGEKITKAWKIHPTNNDYPFAYINDENLEIIYFDNGIWF